MNLIRTTEPQTRCHYRVKQSVEKSNDPDGDSHEGTELAIHDDRIVKWLADSHKAVKCHHCQQQRLCGTQEVEEMQLSYAPQKGNCFACGEEIEVGFRCLFLRARWNLKRKEKLEMKIKSGNQYPTHHFYETTCVDDRVEDWSDHCVEQGNNLGEELGMDSRGRNVQDHECSIECGHHSQDDQGVTWACAWTPPFKGPNSLRKKESPGKEVISACFEAHSQ
ncbi:hypothetical protein U0070_011909 [Myodes glareolus]|uniref:Uncharacterized protein n=1 Tax=Myodes glareolus TaxID=447135 RepID=A0AAW0H6Q5_MYOGA